MSQHRGPRGASEQSEVLSEHIWQNLKKYRKHAERIACLECGYVGPMDIKERVRPWSATWWGVILLAAIAASVASALFDGIGMMAAVIVGSVVGALALSGGRDVHSRPSHEVGLQLR